MLCYRPAFISKTAYQWHPDIFYQTIEMVEVDDFFRYDFYFHSSRNENKKHIEQKSSKYITTKLKNNNSTAYCPFMFVVHLL